MADAPTPDEVTAAQEVLARNAAAKQEARNLALEPLQTMIGSPEFKSVLEIVKTEHAKFGSPDPIYDHLNAILIGMTNLSGDIPKIVAPIALLAPTPTQD